MKNDYGYNDKELWEDGDVNWLDYGFRNYDPQVGRFLQIDPLADEYADLSPYLYAYNDPITNVDEDGLAGGNAVVQIFTGVGAQAAADAARMAGSNLGEVIVKASIKKAVSKSIGKIALNAAANVLASSIEQIGGALLGASNAWTSNQVFGIGRMNPEASGFRGRLGTAVSIGMALGDAASIFTGASEIGASGAGAVLTGGIAMPVAIPIATHGATSMGFGLYHLVNNNIVYSSSGDDIHISDENKIPRDQLNPPSKPGNAPKFKKDNQPVNIHHENQNPKGPFREMHPDDHRKIPNPIKKTNIDRQKFKKQREAYWNKEYPQVNKK